MNLLLQLLANGFVNGALYAMLACAFGLVYRSARIFHIAFAGLFLLAPYGSFVAATWWGWPVWASVSFGVGGAGLSSLFIESALYRPLQRRHATSAAVMVASLGAFVVITNLVAMGFGNEVKTIERGLAQRMVLGPVGLTTVQIWQFVVGVVAVSGLGLATARLRAFKIIWAMGDEPDLVPALGLPMHRYRQLVFMLSGMMAGLAGCLIGYDVGIDPHMGMSYLLIAAVAVLAGGLDSYRGWVLGGFLLALLQSVIVWKLSAKWIDLSTFAVLIGILIFRPQGFLGVKRRLEEG